MNCSYVADSPHQARRLASRAVASALALIVWMAPFLPGTAAFAQTALAPDAGPNTALYLKAWKLYASGDYDRALALAEQGLKADRRANSGRGVAEALNLIGTVHYKRGDYGTALEIYKEAEKAALDSGYNFGLARDWSSLGSTYLRTGNYALAKENYEKSLKLRKKLGAGDDQVARALDDLANVYQQLGNLTHALSLRLQSLKLFRSARDQSGIADVLNDIGWTLDVMGRESDALDAYEQSLAIARQSNLRAAIFDNLESIGIIDGKLERYAEAQASLTQAFDGYRSLRQEDEVSQVLNDIGQVDLKQGNAEKALPRFEEALQVESAMKNAPIQVVTAGGLMQCWQALKTPSLAIFFGKQAVNLLQQMRADIVGLDEGLQQSFLISKEGIYHQLANLLIDQGRLPEAQQVLDLLKRQEYSDYVRGTAGNALSPLSLTPAERAAESDYAESTTQIVATGQQWSALRKISSRTPEQEQQYHRLTEQLNAANKGLNDYYVRLYTLFGGNSGANRPVADVKGDVSLLKETLARMPHTVALYTLVGSERYRVIVVTGSTAVAREYSISAKDLNQKVAELQQALRDPHRDPRPIAAEMYRILIGPVKADLDQAQAQTLVWSLDGALRYVPMAALYDGKAISGAEVCQRNHYVGEHSAPDGKAGLQRSERRCDGHFAPIRADVTRTAGSDRRAG